MPTPSVEQFESDFLTYGDYAVSGDAARATRFAAACRGLLLMRPTRMARGAVGGTNSMEYSTAFLKESLDRVESWLRMQSLPIGVVHAGLGGMRS